MEGSEPSAAPAVVVTPSPDAAPAAKTDRNDDVDVQKLREGSLPLPAVPEGEHKVRACACQRAGGSHRGRA